MEAEGTEEGWELISTQEGVNVYKKKEEEEEGEQGAAEGGDAGRAGTRRGLLGGRKAQSEH